MVPAETEKSLGDFVSEQPGLGRIFERLGFDYCCAGRKSLQQACQERGLDAASVLRVLMACENGRAVDDHGNWGLTTMGQLVDHLIAEHHGFVRAELPRLTALLQKVVAAHSVREPHLLEVQEVFAGLRTVLEAHLGREEQVLFPLIKQLEMARRHVAFNGEKLAGIIQAMTAEHDSASAALHRLQAITHDFAVPEEACDAYRALLEGLRELTQDMHQHVHEENNILYRKALKAEASLGPDNVN